MRSPRVWSTISPATVRPADQRRADGDAASPPTMSTSPKATASPAAPASFSTSITSAAATRYCLPPVLMTAYIPVVSIVPGHKQPGENQAFSEFRKRNARPWPRLLSRCTIRMAETLSRKTARAAGMTALTADMMLTRAGSGAGRAELGSPARRQNARAASRRGMDDGGAWREEAEPPDVTGPQIQRSEGWSSGGTLSGSRCRSKPAWGAMKSAGAPLVGNG